MLMAAPAMARGTSSFGTLLALIASLCSWPLVLGRIGVRCQAIHGGFLTASLHCKHPTNGLGSKPESRIKITISWFADAKAQSTSLGKRMSWLHPIDLR